MFKRKNVRRLAFAIMLAAACMLAGCGSKSDEETDTATEGTAEPTSTPKAEEVKTIGNVYAVSLTNETGKDITGVSVKSDEQETFPDNLLFHADTFADGETRILYCVRTDADVAAQKAGAEPAAVYDVQMTFGDGAVLALHSFPFSDVKEAELQYEDEVLYIVYESISTGETVSTKESELAVKEAEEAAAQAEAEAKAAEEAAAQAEAEAKAAEEAAAEEAARQAAEEAARQAAEEAAAEEAARQAAEEAAAEEAARQAAEEAAAAEAEEGDSEACIGDEGLFY